MNEKSIILTPEHHDILSKFISDVKIDDGFGTFLLSGLKDDQERVVAAIIENNEIVICQIGYTFNSHWDKPNVLPFWVLGRMHARTNTTVECRDSIATTLANYFENLGFTTCYMVSKVKKPTVQKYDKYVKRAFNVFRYSVQIEKIIDSNFEFESLPGLYRTICYRVCEEGHQQIVYRFDLLPEYQTQFNTDLI